MIWRNNVYHRPSEIVFDLIDADNKLKRQHIIENVMREDSAAAVVFVSGLKKALDPNLQYNVSTIPFVHNKLNTNVGEDWYKVRELLTTLSSYQGNQRNISYMINRASNRVDDTDWNMFYGPILLKRPKFDVDLWTWNECARNVSSHLVIK